MPCHVAVWELRLQSVGSGLEASISHPIKVGCSLPWGTPTPFHPDIAYLCVDYGGMYSSGQICYFPVPWKYSRLVFRAPGNTMR
jgi:hypothetical protein